MPGTDGAGVRLVRPQDSEEPPHVGEGLPSRTGDLPHGGGRRIGGAELGEDRAVGERDHHGQVVADDVVHLAGDAGPFVGDREPGPLVAFTLQT